MLVSIWFDGTENSAVLIRNAVNETCTSARVVDVKQFDNTWAIDVYRFKHGVRNDNAHKRILPDTMIIIDNEGITVLNEQYELINRPEIQEKIEIQTGKIDVLRNRVLDKYPDITDVRVSTATTNYMTDIGGFKLDIRTGYINNRHRDVVLYEGKAYITFS